MRKRKPTKQKETYVTNEKYIKRNKINQEHEDKKIRIAIKVRENNNIENKTKQIEPKHTQNEGKRMKSNKKK